MPRNTPPSRGHRCAVLDPRAHVGSDSTRDVDIPGIPALFVVGSDNSVLHYIRGYGGDGDDRLEMALDNVLDSAQPTQIRWTWTEGVLPLSSTADRGLSCSFKSSTLTVLVLRVGYALYD